MTTIETALRQPPTLDELLDDGRRLLAERRAAEQAAAVAAQRQRRDNWQALVSAVRAAWGGLADALPAMPPDGFAPESCRWRLVLAPWKQAAFHTAWERADNSGWRFAPDADWLESTGHCREPFLVEASFTTQDEGYLAEFPHEPCPPQPSVHVRVATLPEAIALCWDAQASWCRAAEKQRQIQARYRRGPEPTSAAPAPAGEPAAASESECPPRKEAG